MRPDSMQTQELLKEILVLSQEMYELSLDQLIQRMLDFAERTTGSTVGFFHFVAEDQNNITMQAWSTNTVMNMCKAQGKGMHYPVAQAGIWADCLRTGKPVVVNDYAHVAGRHGLPTGHAAINRMISVPLRRDGVVKSIVGLGNKATDYTQDDVEVLAQIMTSLWSLIDHKRAEEQQRHQQKSDGLGRMAGAIAHHYNNLMAVVLGNLELVLMKPAMTEGSDRAIRAAMDAARKAADVSGNMLAYLGQSQSGSTSLNLAEICHRVVETGMPAGGSRTTVALHTPASGPAVLGNEPELRQVVSALLRNAYEAIGEAAGRIEINIDSIPASAISYFNRFPRTFTPSGTEFACIEVTDNGCGIAPDDIDKLFDPFYSTKFSGRGLGLAVALGTVKRHGGCITVTSAPGRGSSFRVYLPVQAARPADIPPTKSPEKADSSPNREGRMVLLVEDEPAVRGMTAMMLRHLGLQVIEAENGRVALEIFRHQGAAIDCVLSDLTMPEMNGWETLEHIRAIKPDQPAVLTSGYDPSQMMESARTQRPQAFLPKPFTMASLRRALAQAIPGAWEIA